MIYLGSDHGGFYLKQKIKLWLEEWGYEYTDLGNLKYEEGDDYPQYAFSVAKKVAENKEKNRGILICRSAVGMVIAANKFKGARAAACYDKEMARLSREHNNANIIALSGDFVNDEAAKRIIKIWLTTEFSGQERHFRRIGQIEEDERKTVKD